jgi:hypothetical protein
VPEEIEIKGEPARLPFFFARTGGKAEVEEMFDRNANNGKLHGANLTIPGCADPICSARASHARESANP